MPTPHRAFFKHQFRGGWATAFGPTASFVAPDANGFVNIPYLVEAEDLLYELDGGPRKASGTEKLNSTVLESGAAIRGLYDYWRQGTGGSPTQKRIVYVNGKIYKDDADGSFTSIKTGLIVDAVPQFATFDDLLIIANNSSADVPMSYDGTTFQDLAGSPPNFAFSAAFKNTLFAAGVNATPSTLHFSDDVDPETWSGGTSGSVLIDPNDGDSVTGIVSHKDSLFVFKGPHKGAIHRITGSTFGGAQSDLTRTTFIRGVGCVGQNSIFSFGDDIGFMWSDGSIRTLSATQQFGDFREAALTNGIQDWLDDHLTFTALDTVCAATDHTGRRIYVAVPIDGSTTPNTIIVFDARFEVPRLSRILSYDGVSISLILDSLRPKIFLGGSDGFVRKTQNPARSIDDTTGLNYKVTLPYISYGIPDRMKTFEGMSLGIAPKNNGNIAFKWQRDDETQQSQNINQASSGAVLGSAAANEFVLDTSTLGGARFLDIFAAANEDGGEFRTIQYQFTNSTNNEDVEIHSFGTSISIGAESFEND